MLETFQRKDLLDVAERKVDVLMFAECIMMLEIIDQPFGKLRD